MCTAYQWVWQGNLMLCYNLVRKKMVTRASNREFLISLKGGSAKSYPMNHRFCTYILKKTMHHLNFQGVRQGNSISDWICKLGYSGGKQRDAFTLIKEIWLEIRVPISPLFFLLSGWPIPPVFWFTSMMIGLLQLFVGQSGFDHSKWRGWRVIHQIQFLTASKRSFLLAKLQPDVEHKSTVSAQPLVELKTIWQIDWTGL